MMATNAQKVVEAEAAAKLEFYRLIGEGYKAMQDGRTSTINEVRKKLKKRREERGQGGIVITIFKNKNDIPQEMEYVELNDIFFNQNTALKLEEEAEKIIP